MRMPFALNDYVPFLSGNNTRIEVYPSKEFAEKLCAAYRRLGAEICPLYSLLPAEEARIPAPRDIVSALSHCGKSSADRIHVITGVDGYLLLLQEKLRRDCFIGLRALLGQKLCLRIQLSSHWDIDSLFKNPKYENSLQLVRFMETPKEAVFPSITVIPQKWIAGVCAQTNVPAFLRSLGDFIPDAVPQEQPPQPFVLALPDSAVSADMGYANIITSAAQLVKGALPDSSQFTEELCDSLLWQCTDEKKTITAFLEDSFHVDDLNPEYAPRRLHELRGSSLWPFYAALVKMRIPGNTYLRFVLEMDVDGEHFLSCYLVDGTKFAMRRAVLNLSAYAEERKNAVQHIRVSESQISIFARSTLDDERAVPFLNCKTAEELNALILHCAKADLTIPLPDVYQKSNPLPAWYLSPYFDYGIESLTEYFHKLRVFRVRNTITQEFVKQAFDARMPDVVRSRKEVLRLFESKDTALLVVDGMGAEYYPLLIMLCEEAGMHIAHREIVSAELPTSTAFNSISWNGGERLRNVKQPDNVSHWGKFAHEPCEYEENLSTVLHTFQSDITVRAADGLGRRYQRVVITSDHGSTWMLQLARANRWSRDLTLPDPDDWRYSEVSPKMEASDDFERVFRFNQGDENGKTYFVVRGYNRLSKKGGKPYAVHGGATLEERLVPLVVLTNAAVNATSATAEPQIVEKNAFSLL